MSSNTYLQNIMDQIMEGAEIELDKIAFGLWVKGLGIK